HVAECVNVAFEKSMTPSNITAGFKATGIFPFDENIFTDDDFAVSAVTNRPIYDIYDQNTQIKPNKLFIKFNDIGSKLSKSAPETPKNQVEETPINKYISPQNIRPYPKASPRKKNSNKRRKKYSAILLFPLQKKPEKNTKKHQSLFEIAPAELLNISDTNMSDGNLTDPESFTIDELTGFEELDRDPVEGDYVLVEFKIQKPR
ncbi:tigger transposable element-derived protein 6-like, partial [Aphis craccivora]